MGQRWSGRWCVTKGEVWESFQEGGGEAFDVSVLSKSVGHLDLASAGMKYEERVICGLAYTIGWQRVLQALLETARQATVV